MGQLAGLGMGAYGLSKMAEGGLAFGAGGDVSEKMNDPAAMAAQVDKLSDEQLQAIIQNPTTQAELVAAQQELAMRASERGGMAAAYNQLPQGQQQGVVQAAGGGILAFAGGGDKGEYFQDPMGAPDYTTEGSTIGKAFSPKQTIREGESYTPGLRGMLFGYDVQPKKEDKAVDTAAGEPYNAATATRRSDFETKDKPKVSPEIFSGITKLSKDTGVPAVSLMDEFTKMRDMLKNESKGDMDTLNKMLEKVYMIKIQQKHLLI
jgi:hypothetical protein